jgi:hypothetical protein
MSPRVRKALLSDAAVQRGSLSASVSTPWSAGSRVLIVSVTLQLLRGCFGARPSSIFSFHSRQVFDLLQIVAYSYE